MELNKIYHGDSLELLKKLEDNSIDLVITSPPYSSMKKYIDDNGIPADDYVDWFIPFCKEIERVIKPTGSFILNINDKVESGFRHPYVFDLISRLHKETNLKMFERLFWNKMKSLPNRSRFGDRIEFIFWFAKSKDFKFNLDEMRTEYSEKSIKRMKKPLKKRFSRSEDDSKLEYKDWAPNPKGALPTVLVNISSETKKIADSHAAVYPLALVNYFIRGSTDEGDLVIDPFMGTGTTAVSAKKLNRNYIGFEKQEDYVRISEKRIEECNENGLYKNRIL
jgi:site-specific DNA-methyltransferase (adenine-specific)